MRLVGAMLKAEAMFAQALLQVGHQLYQMRRHTAWCSEDDAVVPPVMRGIEAQFKWLEHHLLCRQIQPLQSIHSHFAKKYQRGVQGVRLHHAPAAQLMQRRLPGGKLTPLRFARPQRKEDAGMSFRWFHVRYFIRNPGGVER